MKTGTDFLEINRRIFRSLKTSAEKAMAQVDEPALFAKSNDDSNSIANIVQHLHGNMLSRWTDFLTTDGEKEWRKRDEEFEMVVTTRAAMMEIWEAGWKVFLDALDALNETHLPQIVYIRGEAHSVMEAVLRQQSHYSYHIGQIVLLCKAGIAGEWQTLTIARRK